MRLALTSLILAALALPSLGGFTDALDPLVEAVRARQEVEDGSTRRGRKDYKALVAAENHLLRESSSVGDDLRALSRCAAKLEKRSLVDGLVGPRLEEAIAALEAATHDARDRLADAAGSAGSARGERKLTKALAIYDRNAEKASRSDRFSRRATKLRAGWKRVILTEDKLGLGAAPEFALVDTNPSSSEFGRTLSPRDYLGKVSAYYFGHST